MTSETKKFRIFLANFGFFFVPAIGAPILATVTGVTPPLLGGRASVLGPIVAAAIYLAHERKVSAQQLLRRAFRTLAWTLMLLVVYFAALEQWTVSDPRSGSRFSIGFGMADWSLTEHGRALIEREKVSTPVELMMADAAFAEGAPQRLWKNWAIVLTSAVLALTFLSSLVLWAAGFGWLAAHMTKANVKWE
jgi:hypothetical protein